MAHGSLSRGSALGLLSAAAVLPLVGRAQGTPIVRAGFEGHAETFAEFNYGIEAGIFSRNGLDVRAATFPTAGPIAAALAGNSLDVGTVDPILLANGVNRGLPFAAIASSGMFRVQEPTSGLCVLSRSPVRKAKDLEGKTIAVGTLVSLISVTVKMWLIQNEADPAKVNFLEMPFAGMPAALQRGTVAAATLTEPGLSQFADEIRMIATPYSAIADAFPISLIVTTRPWLARNPEVATRLVKAIYETAHWANGNRAQTATFLAASSKLDLSVVRRMHRTSYGTSLDASTLQPLLNAAASAKLIDHPISANSLIAHVAA